MEVETQKTLSTITTSDKADAAIENALAIRKALAMGNYVKFFKLYKVSPNQGQDLINVFLDKYRILFLT